MLLGIHTALKDGDTTIEEAFAPKARETGKVKVEDLRPGAEPNRGHGDTGMAEAFPAGGNAEFLQKVAETTGIPVQTAPPAETVEPKAENKPARQRPRF